MLLLVHADIRQGFESVVKPSHEQGPQ